MLHIHLTYLIILLSFSGFCQSIDEMKAMPDKELKTLIQSKPQLCEVSDKEWFNTNPFGAKNQWNNGVSVVHIGSFDDYISLEHMLTLNELQREISPIKFFIVADSKFNYPENQYEVFINRYNLALPLFIDSDKIIKNCLDELSTPLTLVITPNRHILYTYRGLPDLKEMAIQIKELGARLSDLYKVNPHPFLGHSPHQFSKSNLIECPTGIAIDTKNERIFVSDFCGNKVIGLSTQGDVLEVIGTGKPGNKSGEIHSANLKGPRGLAYDNLNDKLYIADSRNNAIKVVDFSILEITKLEIPDLLIYPTGIHFVEAKLYITSPTTVWQMDIVTGSVVQLAGFEDSSDLQGSLNQPIGITSVKEGAVLFSESLSSSISYLENYKVRKSNSNTALSGYKDGKKEEVFFAFPNGMEVHDQDVIIADTYNNSIREYNVFKQKSKTIAGNKESGFADGNRKRQRFHHPSDLAILNNVAYITDTGNGLIRKLDLNSGKVSTLVLSQYYRLCTSYAPNIEDFRTGDPIFVTTGDNLITINLHLKDAYSIDAHGLSRVIISSRNKSLQVKDDLLNDGNLKFKINSEESDSSVLIDFQLFFQNKSNPALKYKRSFSMLFPIVYQSDMESSDQKIDLEFNPDTEHVEF